MKNQIKKYILETYFFSDDESILSDEASLIESGVIDSTGIMEIVLFVEDTFKIKVEENEVLPENLDSINQLVSFVEKKLNNAK